MSSKSIFLRLCRRVKIRKCEKNRKDDKVYNDFLIFWLYIKCDSKQGMSMPAQVAIDNNTVYKLGGFRVDRDIVRYIREASDLSGVSFDYMLAKAGHESRFDADAAAAKSSAEGIYQFTSDTWLQQMKLHGAKYGYAKLAGKIYRDGRGRYRVNDKNVREEILSLRRSPRIASLLAAEFAKSNKKILQDQVGGEITPADLYLAHFMGPSGAVMLLRADKFTPHKLAADLFPDAAMANPPIFYNERNKMRTVRQVRNVLSAIFQDKIERFAVLPKSLKTWLDAQSKTATADRKQAVVVQAPVLRMEAGLSVSPPPMPKLVETLQMAKILPGEGMNLDDDALMESLKTKMEMKAASGENDTVSADFLPVRRAEYDMAGVTGLEADMPSSVRPVYTARSAVWFESDDYPLTSALPVQMTAQSSLKALFDSKRKENTDEL